VIIATGSAKCSWRCTPRQQLAKLKIPVRVVSACPATSGVRPPAACDYKTRLCCPTKLPRMAIEAGVTDFWWKYGCAAVLGIDTLRREARPAAVLFKHFGFTTENAGGHGASRRC
jgi:transketolase